MGNELVKVGNFKALSIGDDRAVFDFERKILNDSNVDEVRENVRIAQKAMSAFKEKSGAAELIKKLNDLSSTLEGKGLDWVNISASLAKITSLLGEVFKEQSEMKAFIKALEKESKKMSEDVQDLEKKVNPSFFEQYKDQFMWTGIMSASGGIALWLLSPLLNLIPDSVKFWETEQKLLNPDPIVIVEKPDKENALEQLEKTFEEKLKEQAEMIKKNTQLNNEKRKQQQEELDETKKRLELFQEQVRKLKAEKQEQIEKQNNNDSKEVEDVPKSQPQEIKAEDVITEKVNVEKPEVEKFKTEVTQQETKKETPNKTNVFISKTVDVKPQVKKQKPQVPKHYDKRITSRLATAIKNSSYKNLRPSFDPSDKQNSSYAIYDKNNKPKAWIIPLVTQNGASTNVTAAVYYHDGRLVTSINEENRDSIATRWYPPKDGFYGINTTPNPGHAHFFDDISVTNRPVNNTVNLTNSINAFTDRLSIEDSNFKWVSIKGFKGADNFSQSAIAVDNKANVYLFKANSQGKVTVKRILKKETQQARKQESPIWQITRIVDKFLKKQLTFDLPGVDNQPSYW